MKRKVFNLTGKPVTAELLVAGVVEPSFTELEEIKQIYANTDSSMQDKAENLAFIAHESNYSFALVDDTDEDFATVLKAELMFTEIIPLMADELVAVQSVD